MHLVPSVAKNKFQDTHQWNAFASLTGPKSGRLDPPEPPMTKSRDARQRVSCCIEPFPIDRTKHLSTYFGMIWQFRGKGLDVEEVVFGP